jgi:hypothetical protein
VVSLYRAENARSRGLDSKRIAAFRHPFRFGEENGDGSDHGPLFEIDVAEDFERERRPSRSGSTPSAGALPRNPAHEDAMHPRSPS